MARATLALLIVTFGVLLCTLDGEREPALPLEPLGAATATELEIVSAASEAAAVGDAVRSASRQEAEPAMASPDEQVDDLLCELTGRLVDTSGRGLAGVDVQFFGQRAAEGPLAARLRRSGRSGADARATSAVSGRFRLAIPAGVRGDLALPRGSDWLFADADGWQLPIPVQRGASDLGDLWLRRAAFVSGTVVDVDGRPIAGARIRVSALDRGHQSTMTLDSDLRTDDSGRFAVRGLDGGRFWIEVHAIGHVPYTLMLELVAAEHRSDIHVVLARGGTVAGQVLDDRGVPVPGARVAALRTIELPSGRETERLDLVHAVATGPDAAFVLGGLEGDRVRLQASAALHGEQLLADVVVGSRITATLPRRAVIQGTLVGAAGRGIEGSRVRVEPRPSDRQPTPSGVPERSSTAHATTGAGGSFHLEDVAPGTVVLHVTGATHLEVESTPITIGAGDLVAGIMLVAEPGACIEVVVVDRDRTPVAGATVAVFRRSARTDSRTGAAMGERSRPVPLANESRGQPMTAGITDEQGRCRATGLPFDDLLVRVDHPDFVTAIPLAVWPLSGTPTMLDVVLECGGYLDVRVVDQAGLSEVACAVTLRGPLGTDQQQTQEWETDGDGLAASGPLRPGRYALFTGIEATHGGMGSSVAQASRVEALVREGLRRVVTLIRPSSAALTGLVRDATGTPLAGAVIRVQEIGTDGKPTGSPRVAHSRGDGRYSIDGLAPGAWSLRYGIPELPLRSELVLSVPDGVTRIEQNLDLETGIVSVLVTDESGAPVTGATLVVQPGLGAEADLSPRSARGRIDLARLAHARTGRTGRARIDAVTAGEYTLEVRGPGLASVRVGVVVRANEWTELDPVRLVRGGTPVIELGEPGRTQGTEIRAGEETARDLSGAGDW